MDYLELVSMQPAEKDALIIDDEHITYASLTKMASELRAKIDINEKAHFIYEEGILEQLLYFLVYSGTSVRPIIATQASKNSEFDFSNIPEKACMGVLTSGSTGKSKLLWRSFSSWASFFEEQNAVFGLNKDTVIFCQGSLAFTGNLNMYMAILAAGGTIVATNRFRPRYWLEQMQKYGVNAIYLIPTKLMLLPKHLQEQLESHRELRERVNSIVSGSQSLGKDEAKRLRTVFTNAQITLYYGASELNYISYIKDDEMTEDRTLIGKPFRGVEVEVRGEEFFVNTPYGVEDITLPFSLKDRGSIDEVGRMHFLGRTDDIMSVNGRKVSAQKVEQALQALDFSRGARVLAIHVGDEDVPVAFVVGEAHTKQELTRLLKGSLEDYELPKQYVFLEEMPLNESGKIDKKALLAIYEQKA